MAEPLETLALRLENDPFFLSCPLRLYSKSMDMTEQQLAERLGCSLETLVLVRLCRAPKDESGQFQVDVARVAKKFQINAEVLTEAIRRGQAIWHLRPSQAGAARTMLAARDGKASQEEDQ